MTETNAEFALEVCKIAENRQRNLEPFERDHLRHAAQRLKAREISEAMVDAAYYAMFHVNGTLNRETIRAALKAALKAAQE